MLRHTGLKHQWSPSLALWLVELNYVGAIGLNKAGTTSTVSRSETGTVIALPLTQRGASC